MNPDIRDVKPVLSPADHTAVIIIILILAAIAALLVYYFLKNRRQAKTEKVVPERPAWEIALEKLERLRNDDLAARGEIKKYYTVLGDIVRWYVERRFSVRAPEMTTPEFLEHLAGLPHLNAQQKDTLKDFMNSCDMVKFAKFTPEASYAEESYRIALKLIEDTK